ncbi:acyltransferase family protein [[Enterobacter] lignolyticus]|uniref:Acyltransferase 3 n=1 Tax=Enterobacter lignolyticus (strain SCF1) TaxID=701347 RepID=E3GBE0_ENTLS|nr:acyltransferase [[Enterobacter] lignolyticus]ADO48903.1 acyltransferase 3 [[Enterobacter] lignolyticus SCF1]
MKKTTSEILERGNNNFDLLRIIAASAVIIYHSFALNPSWGLTDPTKNILTYVTTGGLAVKLFFFISGLLVTNSLLKNKSLVHFIISRAFRIIPALYFVILVPSLFIGPLLTSLSAHEYYSSGLLYEYIFRNLIIDTRYFLPGVSFENTYGFNGSIWTIRYEALCYITLAFLFSIGLHKYTKLSSIICLIIIFEPITPFKGFLFASSDNNGIYLLAPCFALGSLVALHKNSYRPSVWHAVALLIAAVIFHRYEITFSLLVCCSACLFALSLSANRWFIKLKIKNDISYGVYLWGFPIQQILSKYQDLGPVFGITASLFLSYLVASFSWKYIEKPAITLGKKISSSFVYSLPQEKNRPTDS